MRIRFSFVGTAALLLAACGDSGDYYEKSPEQIAQAISNAETSPIMVGNIDHSTVSKPNPNTVIITGNDAFGGDVFRITANLTPEGSGTRVETSFKMLHEKKGYDEYMAGTMAKEHVASAIEGRAPNVMAAANPMAKVIVNSNPEMSKTMNQALNTQLEMEKLEKQSKFDKEYGDDWAASGDSGSDGWGD